MLTREWHIDDDQQRTVVDENSSRFPCAFGHLLLWEVIRMDVSDAIRMHCRSVLLIMACYSNIWDGFVRWGCKVVAVVAGVVVVVVVVVVAGGGGGGGAVVLGVGWSMVMIMMREMNIIWNLNMFLFKCDKLSRIPARCFCMRTSTSNLGWHCTPKQRYVSF